jgi:hypothetical protein
MSKVIIPFGEVRKRIVIEADDKGLVRINANNIVLEVKRGFRPQSVEMPMDAREMVLACIKVIQDYSTVIFASMGEGLMNHGKANKNEDNDHSGQSG